MLAPSRTLDQFVVRFPEGMRDAIRRKAAESERSMNAEIIFHLRKALGETAGGEFGDQSPAAGNDNAALPGGASITQGIGGAANE